MYYIFDPIAKFFLANKMFNFFFSQCVTLKHYKKIEGSHAITR